MLAPDGRAVLLDELRPPAGYALDAAVATTFTLDLTAALVPPLAFASFGLSNSPDPVAALEAVRACTDRVDIFCQAGQIGVPTQASDLMAFLEPMVHEVRRPRAGHLFHPKTWLLRYRNTGQPDLFRLLCLTRNLTDGHSWDVVLRLDGSIGTRPSSQNRPLVQLIRALPGLATAPLPAERHSRIMGLAEDARRITWELPDDVNEINFHVFGLPGVRGNADFSGYRHLVVAPFLSDEGLALVAPGSRDIAVVSREEGLDQLRPDTVSAITPYIVSDLASLDETGGSDDLPAWQILTGLHAKVYVAERNRRAHVYIGSANATAAAFGGNVEILVELVGGATKIGVTAFLGEDAPFRRMLEPYSTDGGAEPDPLDEARRALEDLLRDLAAIQHVVTVSLDPAGGYAVAVTTNQALPIPADYKVSLELLTRQGDAHPLTAEPVSVTFGPVPLADVTPFLVVQATSPEGLRRGTVIRGLLRNDPPGRLDEILARQVDTPEKFLRFVALLLSLGNPYLLAALAGSDAGSSADIARSGPAPGIFELVLRALADRPAALTDLDRLVQRLQATDGGRQVLPDGFNVLWSVVIDARRQLETAAQG